MNIYTITTGSECSYTDLVVVANGTSEAAAMLDAWCAECTVQERDACATADTPDPLIFTHQYDLEKLNPVDADDLEDYAEYPHGVTMIASGMNG